MGIWVGDNRAPTEMIKRVYKPINQPLQDLYTATAVRFAHSLYALLHRFIFNPNGVASTAHWLALRQP
jgi:hypothetical protein